MGPYVAIRANVNRRGHRSAGDTRSPEAREIYINRLEKHSNVRSVRGWLARAATRARGRGARIPQSRSNAMGHCMQILNQYRLNVE